MAQRLKALIGSVGYGPTKSRALIQNMRAVARPALVEVTKFGVLTRANARCGEVAPSLQEEGSVLAGLKTRSPD
jgi:hypothetical protein